MSANNLWPWLLVFVALDLVFTVVRAGLAHARLSTLAALREKNPNGVRRVVALLEEPTLRLTLHSLGVVIHFLLVGTLTLAAASRFATLPVNTVILLLLVLAALETGKAAVAAGATVGPAVTM